MSATHRSSVHGGQSRAARDPRPSAQTRGGSAWPVVGRDEEIRQALWVLNEDVGFPGVVLVGDSGTGKSTLARALATTLNSAQHTVRFALGTETGRDVPLGAFCRLVTLDAAHEPAAMLAATQKALEQEKNLVLVVDDAQLLDPLSATLLHQLAAGRASRLIVVIRSGEAVPGAVTALWKDQLLMRMEINPFTQTQTGELARAVLGGVVENRLVEELHDRTGGNLLLLRGLLTAGRDSNVLVQTHAGWRLHGPLRGDDELYDLLEFRLRSLSPEELEVMEVVATAEVLDWDILRMVTDADAVARLERRSLIQLVPDGSHVMARLIHPVFGEAALRRAGVLRTRRLNSMLVQQLQRRIEAAEQRSRPPDVRSRIQLAQFMMRSDLAADLDVIVGAAASAVAMSSLTLGEELARFAFSRGGGLRAALVLAEAMSWQGQGAQAEQVLADVDVDRADAWQLVQWGCRRAANLFWVCGQVELARRVLADVKGRIGSGAGVGLVIEALEVSFAFFSGEIATTIGTGPGLCASAEVPNAMVWAAVPTSGALAAAGQFGESHRIASAGGAEVLGKMGPHRFAVGMIEVVAATAAGDFPAAERVCERYAESAAGMPAADAMVEAIRGHVHLARGALASACAAFDASVSAFSQGFPTPWLMLVAAQLAQAEGVQIARE